MAEWMAYDAIEPMGEERADYRNALLISQMVNIAISIWGKDGAKPTIPQDFMPKWGTKSKKKEQSVEELGNDIKSIFGAMAQMNFKKHEVQPRTTPPRLLASAN